ncbi:MAG: CDP-diacylglycerol--glycerol-3-phosphate 3-phosphatidyltransferase [Oscillospiraceae bacterium]|nr:CDP-diacylglycerol--glycerol-3-phosphate 3-phosphatidyltransferase [Oscillospiraceae bacterium]MDD7041694.1 CDP-diacylglycerol--glycerol-3-phosphate 3-phosphatidyltransferase [Oscillospiraceae bacterium]MDY2611976.1 CDP-diacylglycerol--glycerol-3-phosphate 3-phosphatidyltransferase [Oscillospiraceae bacterium]
MNLPNKLTCLRMLMVPFFVAAMVLSFSNHYLWALILFVTASFTDMLDGKIARKRGLITDFGKFMDPLADKILVTSALICFVELWVTPAAVIIVIIAREFVVTSLRLIAAPKGIVIAADIFGKMKTVSQMIWVATTIVQMYLEEELLIGIPLLAEMNIVLMWVTLGLTVVSGINYLWKNRAVLSDMK